MTDTSLSPSPKSKVWVGAFYMAAAMFLFGIGNALVKETAQTCSVVQIIFFRSLWALITLLAYMVFTKKIYLWKTQKSFLQISRGVIGFVSLCAMYYSFDVLPLTDGTALVFASPLFITALSYPMLKEKVEFKIWVAVFIGFAGVSIMANPSGHVTAIGVGAGIFSAFLEAIIAILARKLSSTENPVTTTFYHTLVLMLFAGAFLPFFWNAMSVSSFMLLIVLGILSAIGQVFMVAAYGAAPAAVVAPLLYTLMIWAALVGYMRWDEGFRLHLLIGAPIVIASGLYILFRENRIENPTSR
jgi:drug/metabolite transporter (DMT)-like permease